MYLRNTLTLLFLCFYGTIAKAQWFTQASIPDNGGRGPHMDVRAADIDGDGDLDIILANEGPGNTIMRNNGMGVFTNFTSGNLPQPQNDSEDVAIADFDGDGNLDLVFCSEDDFPAGQMNVHEYYLNDGSGKFTAFTGQLIDSEANCVIVGYVNQDSFPDLLFGNKGRNFVLINRGNGEMVYESLRLPNISRTTQDLGLFDMDGDQDDDLFEANEDGNLLLINDGTGVFTDVSSTHLPQGLNLETRKVAFADVDGDQDIDVFLANVAFLPGKDPQNRLFLNDGSGHFTDATSTHLPMDSDLTIEAIFEDLDGNGSPDLVLGNVFGAHLKAYLNDGQGRFSDSTLAVFGQNYALDALGIISADLNGDQLKDLYICHRGQTGSTKKDVLLLRNQVSGLPQEQKKLATWSVYPNPMKETFAIVGVQDKVERIEIFHQNGQLLESVVPILNPDGNYQCRLKATYASGNYWLVANHAWKQIFILSQ
jgi:hypothetical protein